MKPAVTRWRSYASKFLLATETICDRRLRIHLSITESSFLRKVINYRIICDIKNNKYNVKNKNHIAKANSKTIQNSVAMCITSFRWKWSRLHIAIHIIYIVLMQNYTDFQYTFLTLYRHKIINAQYTIQESPAWWKDILNNKNPIHRDCSFPIHRSYPTNIFRN